MYTLSISLKVFDKELQEISRCSRSKPEVWALHALHSKQDASAVDRSRYSSKLRSRILERGRWKCLPSFARFMWSYHDHLHLHVAEGISSHPCRRFAFGFRWALWVLVQRIFIFHVAQSISSDSCGGLCVLAYISLMSSCVELLNLPWCAIHVEPTILSSSCIYYVYNTLCTI